MSTTPYFRSPFTDLTGAIVSHQWGGRCSDFEMKALDCMEAYGFERGLRKCESLIADFNECSLRTKEIQRFYAMRNERERQYKAGERTKEDRYAESPKSDSF